ncbi:MAG: sigma-70 family RNA polymerase sigma factor, partial [Alphaproteobacteria bacterium]
MSSKNKNSPFTSNNEIKWHDLAVMAQAGDKKAYHLLLGELAVYIRNFLMPRLANPDWAEDITQEVLISVHKSLRTYSPDRPFIPWLMAIVNFRKADFLRTHYNRKRDMQTGLDNPEFQSSHVTSSEFSGELKDIEKILQDLPEKQRKIIELMKIQGFS